jgi:hypothetical protein
MTRSVSRPWTLPLLLLVSLFLTSACLMFGAGASPTTTVTALTPGSLAATSAPALTPGTPAVTPEADATGGSPEITAQGSVDFGPGAFNFLDPAAGLAKLASYSASLTLSFTGMEAGQPSQWSKTYVLLSSLKPAGRQLTITSSGQLADLEPVFMAEVAGAAYERNGLEECSASLIEAGVTPSALVEPAGSLAGVIGATAAGSETANGVPAQHYTFDEHALGQSGFARSIGELWVAVDGGYLVSYVLSTHAGAEYFGEGIEGTATWNYQLTGINLPVAIDLPQDCPAGKVDAPLLADAAGVVTMPGFVSFTTGTTPPDVSAFYEARLPELGWKPVGDPVVDKTLALLDFTRDDQQLSLVITQDETGTTVQLVVGPIEPS